MTLPGPVVAVGLAAVGAGTLTAVRVPAGPLIGALFGVIGASALHVAVWHVSSGLVTASAIAVGILLGVRVSRSAIRSLRAIAAAALLVGVVMVGGGLGIGLVLHNLWRWDQPTAAFSAYPGGLEQMILLAGSLGGNVYAVTTVQLVRWIATVAMYPIVFRALRGPGIAEQVGKRGSVTTSKSPHGTSWTARDYLAVLGGVFAGVLGGWSGVPAGALLGGMLGTALVRVSGPDHPFEIPNIVTVPVLAAVGYVLGANVPPEALRASGTVFLVAGFVTLILLAISVTLGIALWRATGWPLPLCLVAVAPAGTLEMTLLAEQMGLDARVVFTLHFTRMVSVIIMAPMLYGFVG